MIENADYLGEPLEYIYKKPIDKATLPNGWKRAKVAAVYKKRPHEFPGN